MDAGAVADGCATPIVDGGAVAEGSGAWSTCHSSKKIEDPVLYDAQYACPRAAGEYIPGTDMFGSPKARERVDELAVRLREHTQTIRALAKKIGGGEKTKGQTAGAMMEVARRALAAKHHEVARRAVEVAVGYDGENASIVGEAAILLRKAGSKADDVDGMFGKALDLDPTNADAWLEWGRFKAETRAPHGQVMRCYERALEADGGRSRPSSASPGAFWRSSRRRRSSAPAPCAATTGARRGPCLARGGRRSTRCSAGETGIRRRARGCSWPRAGSRSSRRGRARRCGRSCGSLKSSRRAAPRRVRSAMR